MAWVENFYTSYFPLLVLFIVALGLIYFFLRDSKVIWIIMFSLLAEYVYFPIGSTRFEIWAVLSVLFIIFFSAILKTKSLDNFRKSYYPVLLINYVIFPLITTFLFFFVTDEINMRVEGGFFKNEGRGLFQSIYFLLETVLILFPLYFLKRNDIGKIMPVLFHIVLILAVLGLIQYISVHYLNFNPFRIVRANTIDDNFAITRFGTNVFRLYSIVGEAKHFAIVLVLGINAIVIYRIQGSKISSYDYPCLILFLFCLYNTFSTSGISLIAISFVFLFGLSLFKRRYSIAALLLGSTILILAVGLTVVPETNLQVVLGQVSRIGLEYQDQTVLEYFKNNPFSALTGVGLGYIHYFSGQYFPSGFSIYMNVAYRPVSGLFYLLGDRGLVGIFLILLLFFITLRDTKKTLLRVSLSDKIIIQSLQYFTCLVFILFFMRYMRIFYLLLGVLLFISLRSNEFISIESSLREYRFSGKKMPE